MVNMPLSEKIGDGRRQLGHRPVHPMPAAGARFGVWAIVADDGIDQPQPIGLAGCLPPGRTAGWWRSSADL
jgi:hypothetical protein